MTLFVVNEGLDSTLYQIVQLDLTRYHLTRREIACQRLIDTQTNSFTPTYPWPTAPRPPQNPSSDTPAQPYT